MTPADALAVLTTAGYLCLAAVIVAVTAAVCLVAAVGFVLAAGWLVSTFRPTEGAATRYGHDENGNPVLIKRFPTGQVGTIPMQNGRANAMPDFDEIL